MTVLGMWQFLNVMFLTRDEPMEPIVLVRVRVRVRVRAREG